MDDHQSKGAVIASDAIVPIDIGFGAVGNFHTRTGVVADHVLRSRSYSVTAVQNQMAGQHSDSESTVAGDCGASHVAVHVEGTPADTDSRPCAVLDGAVGDVDVRIEAGQANPRAVLHGNVVEVDAGIFVHDKSTAAIEGNALDVDPLRVVDGQQMTISVARHYRSRWVAKNRQVGARKEHDVLVAGAYD